MEEVTVVVVTAFLVSFYILLYLSTSKVDRVSFWKDTFLLGICSLACFGSILGSAVMAFLVNVTFGLPLAIGYLIGGLFFIALSCFAWWRTTRKLEE